MAYPPGSFSKNFAWHGTGLRRLHEAIRDGFKNTLTAVDRQRFRSDSGIEGAIDLIPINFFLHNSKGKLSVDELVFQAVERDHTPQFDRLALFALNLSRVGSGETIVSRPAMWANEFVRERLWSDGSWRQDALSDQSLDEFLTERMTAQANVRVKCRNNYRHIFRLCNLWPSTLPEINTNSDHWVSSALFLTWDRHILDGGASEVSDLIALVDSDELYKLLGVSQVQATSLARPIADLYQETGKLDRFTAGANSLPQDALPHVNLLPELDERTSFEWLEQDKSDQTVDRRMVERRELARNRRIATELKLYYVNTCQICGVQLNVGSNNFFSEAAHIRGLGGPHNGPDSVDNMLVLCPNHHIQFDRGVLRLQKVGDKYQILSKTVGDPLHGKTIMLKHSLTEDHIIHHFNWFR